MEAGAEVWLRDKIGRNAWLPAIIQSKQSVGDGSSFVIIRTSTGDEYTFKIGDSSDADHDDVKLRNAFEDADTEDLINLPYLHEPAILCCLEQRYGSSNIYTYTGPILIAVNPFKKVNLYTAQTLELYYNVGLLKSQGIEGSGKLPPHVYAVADAAYRNMMTSVHNAGTGSNCNQSILISGESGAGKTESTKIVLKYLTTVGNSSGGLQLASGSVMDKILQSNPILEAFGNARTIRNDNSSRFGKFIELNFNRRGHLIGGMIRTYLLEKVRLPTQQPGERNFHVFYQMAVGGSAEELNDWGLTSIEDFWFTNQGGIFELQHVNDEDEFNALRNALNTLNFELTLQANLFQILAALMHLGQLRFIADSDGEGSEISNDQTTQLHLATAARLLGIDASAVSKTFTIRIINARGELYEKKLTTVQASDARDALAKSIYGQIFQWLVENINKSIQVDAKNVRADIGVLDIFGFECFKQNSFEQLCINYTNETLQQQFNQFIFKIEQIEYQKEKIEWSFVEFPDNQDCLDLIEHKLNGILAMIDDECKLPKASDEKLAARMYKAFESNKRFTATVTQKRDWLFCVNHYAGPVVYSTITFVDKNKDELSKESSTLLQSSTSALLPILFGNTSGSSISAKKETNSKSSVVSVGAQFKEQLSSLMEKIYATSPHYIRCLKPNDLNKPDCLDRVRVTEQLRYGGVLEAVRVARSGFPVRLIHPDFYSIYRPLANPLHPIIKSLPRILVPDKHNAKDLCQKLVHVFFDKTDVALPSSMTSWKKKKLDDFKDWSGPLILPAQNIQLGQTKVFLRKTAHDILESKRSKRLLCAAILIQSKFRGYLAVKTYIYVMNAVSILQRTFRMYAAIKKVNSLRRLKASIILQSFLRRFISRSKFVRFRNAVLRIQCHYRRRVAKSLYRQLHYSKKSLQLQRICRGLIALHKYRKFRRAIISLQSKFRCVKAVKILKALRVAAKDVGKLKQSNESLKHEIEMLKAKAAEDARKLQEQTRRELEEASAQLRVKEISAMTSTIEELKQTIFTEINLKNEAEKSRKQAEEKYKHLESLIESEYIPKMWMVEEYPSIKSQLTLSKEKILELEDKLRLQTDIILRYQESKHEVGLSLFPKIEESIVLQTPINHKTEIKIKNTNPDNGLRVENEEYERVINELAEERVAKEVLEEEVARLRLISLDLTAQIESLRRNNTKGRVTTSTPESSRILPGDVQAQRRTSLSTPVLPVQSRRPSMNRSPSIEDDEKDRGDSFNETIIQESPIRPTARRRNSVLPGALSTGIAEPPGAMEKFEKNIEHLQNKLKGGITGQVWDGTKVLKVDAVMKLDDNGKSITFNPIGASRRFNFFARVEIDPVRVSAILDCTAGSNVASEASEDYRLLTITAASENSIRTIAFKVSTRDERNSLLTTLRALLSNSQINITPTSTPTSRIQGNIQPTSGGVKALRKKSIRDAALEEAISASLLTPPAPISSHQPARRRNSQYVSAPSDIGDANSVVSDDKKQINTDKQRNEKSIHQVVQLTNDLLEREDQILELKRREAEFSQKIAAKDKMYEQDALVRMQLGKRLEQVLMDKEDALEQVEFLKEQLTVLRESLALMSQTTTPVNKK